MKKLTLEERIEQLEEQCLDQLCWMCHRELRDNEHHGSCDRCRHGELEDEG